MKINIKVCCLLIVATSLSDDVDDDDNETIFKTIHTYRWEEKNL